MRHDGAFPVRRVPRHGLSVCEGSGSSVEGMVNPKLVRFSNGMWGVRLGLLFHRYVDLKHSDVTWRKGCQFFKHCMADEATARAFYNGLGVGVTDEVME